MGQILTCPLNILVHQLAPPEHFQRVSNLFLGFMENPRQAQTAINVNTHKKPICQYERPPLFGALLETMSELKMVWL